MIRNQKTVDPSDSDSPAVYQLETAMGTAIETFEGSQAVIVARWTFDFSIVRVMARPPGPRVLSR